MIKGLSSAPKPFLKSVILESSNDSEIHKKTQMDLYYDNPSPQTNNSNSKIKITLDFYIKAIANYSNDNSSINIALKNILNQSYLFWIPITNKQTMLDFLKLSETAKKTFVSDIYSNSFLMPWYNKRPLKSFFNGQQMQDYVSFINPKSFEDKQQRMLTIPVRAHDMLNANANPNFLGYIYFLSGISGNSLAGFVQNSIGTEIIFNDGQIFNKSGNFVIDKTFKYDNVEQELTKAEIPTNLNLIDPSTGESTLPNIETDRNQQVNYLYGAPDDTWVGPIHWHMEDDPTDSDYVTYRAMAGAEHDNSIPHPFLKYIIKGNNKIIDFRGINAIEDVFSYKSSLYEAILAASSNVLYTGQKKNKLIDDFVEKKAVVSEVKYSIRRQEAPTGPGLTIQVTKERRAPVLFFSIDKKSLLRETTKVPSLLDKMARYSTTIYGSIIKDINIFSFEIIRIDKKTKTSKSLLVSSSDNSHVQIIGEENNSSVKKALVFKNKTNSIHLASGNDNKTISLYEFFDGSLDAIKDNGKYTYKIKLKYRDPMIAYLNNKLIQLRRIISNLDELAQKTDFMILDPSTGKFMTVYDRFQKQLNPTFVQQTLEASAQKLVPLSFSFNAQSELPESVEAAFPATGGENLNSLQAYMILINTYFFNESFQDFTSLIDKIRNFIRSSLVLSTTTPDLIRKVRSLLDLVRSRTEDIIALYSTEQVVKKSSGFSTKDYIQGTNVANTDTYVIEFEHEFKNTLDLSKTKDFFDFIAPVPAVSTVDFSPLKSISYSSYKALVQGNIPGAEKNILTEEGKQAVGSDADYSYSFMNMYNPTILKYEKAPKDSLFDSNYLRAIRKNLIHNITGTPKSVLIPEILGTFGIRFPLLGETIKDYIQEKMTYNKGETPINIGGSGGGIIDNFGVPYVENEIIGNTIGGYSPQVQPAYGSVKPLSSEDDPYEWAGMSFSDYPYNCAISLVNLINTNVYERSSISYLNSTYANLIQQGVIVDSEFNTANKNIPHMTNVFSTANTAIFDIQPKFLSDTVLMTLFDAPQTANGSAILQHYNFYSYYLNIFAKVYYLHGFHERDISSFSGNPSKFSYSARRNNKFVKSMDWRELNASILETFPARKSLLCKVMLFEGEKVKKLFDQKVINLFRGIFNQNKLFLIQKRTNPGLLPEASQTPQINESLQEFNNLIPSDSHKQSVDIQNGIFKNFADLADQDKFIKDKAAQQEEYNKRKKAMLDGAIKLQAYYNNKLSEAVISSGFAMYDQPPIIIGGGKYGDDPTWLAPAGSRSTIKFHNVGRDDKDDE